MQATVAESRANLARLRQVAELSGGKVPSKAELETAEATLQRAVANEASARAAVTQARQRSSPTRPTWPRRSIRSPINGVVLARKVEPGQTVAASLTGAGAVHPGRRPGADGTAGGRGRGRCRPGASAGQPATFTVYAWPGRKYPAHHPARRLRLADQRQRGLLQDHPQGRQRRPQPAPGHDGDRARSSPPTRENVLLVPNAALRFTPPTSRRRQQQERQLRLQPAAQAARQHPTKPASAAGKAARSRCGCCATASPWPCRSTTGVSNGRQTEVIGGELKAGMQVITE